MFRLYLITDRRLAADLPAAVERALSSLPRGAAAVQLREKDLSARQLLELALRIRAVCVRYATPLLVNDRLDVALAAGADGVHLSGSSMSVADARDLLGPHRLIGASCHSQAQVAERAGADFVTYGPVFATPGKGSPTGLGVLREIPAKVFALGGIDASNAAQAIEAGAHGVAAIRSWLAGDAAELWAGVIHSPKPGPA